MSAEAIQDLTVQTLNVSLMLSVGLELDLSELRAVLRRRGLLVGVTVVNFGLVPAVALGLTAALGLSGAMAAGLLLCAFAPGGGTGTLLTRVAGGNLELSVVMLAVFTVLAVPLTPALTLWSLGGASGSGLSLAPMLGTLVSFQLTPLLIGLAMRRWAPPLADRVNGIARPLSNMVFAGLVLGLLITRGHLVTAVDPMGLIAIAGVVAVTLAAPLLMPGPPRDRAAVSLTTGVRNLALVLLLSTTFFDAETTIAVLAYGLIMYIESVPLALRWRRG